MRILLDADTPIQMLSLLRHVLRGHTVNHVHELGWSKKKDVPLLRDASAADYDVFVTNDANQFDDAIETAAIRKSRLHHVRYAQRRSGLQELALAIGAVVAAMPGIIKHLEAANGQRLIHVKGLDPKIGLTEWIPDAIHRGTGAETKNQFVRRCAERSRRRRVMTLSNIGLSSNSLGCERDTCGMIGAETSERR